MTKRRSDLDDELAQTGARSRQRRWLTEGGLELLADPDERAAVWRGQQHDGRSATSSAAQAAR